MSLDNPTAMAVERLNHVPMTPPVINGKELWYLDMVVPDPDLKIPSDYKAGDPFTSAIREEIIDYLEIAGCANIRQNDAKNLRNGILPNTIRLDAQEVETLIKTGVKNPIITQLVNPILLAAQNHINSSPGRN